MTIKEVSQAYNIPEATLRYYEKEGIIFNVERKNGIRNYNEENLSNIEFVKCMRNAGMSIERLKQYITLIHVTDSEQIRKAILEDQRQDTLNKIEELNKTLDKLNYKIDNYQKIILEKEKNEKGGFV